MNKNPIVFALANPTPEISYTLAKQTRSDVIMATGISCSSFFKFSLYFHHSLFIIYFNNKQTRSDMIWQEHVLSFFKFSLYSHNPLFVI
jgi:hypothetical protein